MNQDDNGITKLGCVNHDCDKCKAQQQKPVAKVVTDNSRELIVESLNSKYLRKGTKLYTSPQSKPWVGLTNQELIDLTAIYSGAPLYCAIEAKLKEKNGQI